ncbi:MAG: aminotransferase class I/II-fold pyridoxal phosphate-dependent enzyme [Gemmatimonadetes bacterium]|nr:aminotransferase class I/II-fold pyridoxal phosphate-dependent enzyme [Gemmatimonadota bacterium]
MSGRFPRPDYRSLELYDPGRRPVALDLSDNTNRWGAHPAAIAAVRAADDDALTRYPDLYASELKAAIARRYRVPVDAIATGAGSDDVLDSAFRAAGPEGGVVTYPGPTFSMVDPFARMSGRVGAEVPWSRALADPGVLLEGDPVIVYVCRPNNPTGDVAPRPWLDDLLAAAGGAAGPLVVLDEAYADFADESLIEEAPSIPNLLITRTLSKAYGLAGFRVGFAVGAPETAREVEKSRGPYKVSRLAERAAVAALDDADGWAARVTRECVANRARLFTALTERGLKPLPSRANFIFFPVPGGSARAWNDALRARGVAVRPFPACPDLGDGMRVSIAPWPMLERFLAALDAVLAAGEVPAPAGSRP